MLSEAPEINVPIGSSRFVTCVRARQQGSPNIRCRQDDIPSSGIDAETALPPPVGVVPATLSYKEKWSYQDPIKTEVAGTPL